MAFILDGFVLSANIATIIDTVKQYQRSKEWEIKVEGATIADQRDAAQAEASDLLADFALVTDGSIITYSLSEKWVNDAAVGTNAELYREGLMTLAVNDAGSKKASHTIPAPKTSIMNGDADGLDPTNTDLIAYLAHFKAAGGATLSDGESIRDSVPLLKSSLKWVKSGVSY